MATKSNIISWTLEYACKFKYHNVISSISKKTSTNIEKIAVPKLYLVTSALHSIVSSEEFDNYHQAIYYLEYLYEICKDFIPFRIYSRLITGYKMVVLLKMLEENKEGVLQQLNEFFPRSGRDYTHVDKKELQRLSSVHSNFRKFYLSLTASNSLRVDYLRDDYQEEYGPEFHSSLTRLTNKFLSKIDEHLPLTMFEKLMKCTEDQCYELHEDSPLATFEILLDIVLGKSQLTEADLMQLLEMLGDMTVTECKRVQPLDYVGLYTSSERCRSGKEHDGSKSLISSSSESDKNKSAGKTNISAEKSNLCLSNEECDSRRTDKHLLDSENFESQRTDKHLLDSEKIDCRRTRKLLSDSEKFDSRRTRKHLSDSEKFDSQRTHKRLTDSEQLDSLRIHKRLTDTKIDSVVPLCWDSHETYKDFCLFKNLNTTRNIGSVQINENKNNENNQTACSPAKKTMATKTSACVQSDKLLDTGTPFKSKKKFQTTDKDFYVLTLNLRASASSSSSEEVQSSCKRPARFQRSSLRLGNKSSRTKATDIPDKSIDVYSDEHNEVDIDVSWKKQRVKNKKCVAQNVTSPESTTSIVDDATTDPLTIVDPEPIQPMNYKGSVPDDCGDITSEPQQVYYISSSSNEHSSKNDTCIEICSSSPEIEILTTESSECEPDKSVSDIFDSGSDGIYIDDLDNDFVPTSDLDEIDLDEIYNYDLERLSPKTTVSIPQISSCARHPDLKLCIIKLYRNESLDVKWKEQHFSVYS